MHMIIYVHLFKQDEVADEQRRSLHPVRMFDRSDRDNAMTKPATDRFLFVTPRTVGCMLHISTLSTAGLNINHHPQLEGPTLCQ